MIKKWFASNKIIFLGFLFLFMWYGFLTFSYISNYKLLVGSDFRAFYAVGRISNEHGGSSVYNISLEKEQQERLAGHPIQSGQVLTYNHPPFLLPVFYLISKLNFQVAFGIYFIFLFLVAALFGLLLIKIFPPDQLAGKFRSQLFLSILLFEPLFISILKGQDTVILLAGLTVFAYGLINQNDRLSGLGLALTLIRPQVSLFLALPLVFYNRKLLSWYIFGACILALYSFFLVGTEGMLDFLNLMEISLRGQEFGLNPAMMFNLAGLVLRIFPAFNSSILSIIKIVGYVGCLLIFVITFRQHKTVELRHFVPLIICSLFFSPHLHFHDLAILLIPVIILFSYWLRQNRIGSILPVNILFLLSILFLMSNIITPLYFIIPYLVMFIILLVYIKEEWFLPKRGQEF